MKMIFIEDDGVIDLDKLQKNIFGKAIIVPCAVGAQTRHSVIDIPEDETELTKANCRIQLLQNQLNIFENKYKENERIVGNIDEFNKMDEQTRRVYLEIKKCLSDCIDECMRLKNIKPTIN